jgi:hypothetical protein
MIATEVVLLRSALLGCGCVIVWGMKRRPQKSGRAQWRVEVKVERKPGSGRKEGLMERQARRVLDKLLNFWRRSCDSSQIFVGHAVSGPVTTGNQLTRVQTAKCLSTLDPDGTCKRDVENKRLEGANRA